MATSNSTIPIQKTVNFCSTHADLLPLAGVGGYTDEPALTLANDAMSDIFSDPNDWKFNRVEMAPIFTQQNRIDILFAGASIFSLGTSLSGSQSAAIDLSSNSAVTVTSGTVTINTLEAHRFQVGDVIYTTGIVMTTGTAANYNSTFTDNGSISQWNTSWTLTAIGTKSVSFAKTTGQNNNDVGGALGITNFGYGTSASFQEVNNSSSPPNIQPATIYRELAYISRVANPDKVSVLSDLGTGVLKIRHSWVPGSTMWQTNIVYQAKPPLKVALTDTWAPIPDNYQSLFNQALLYRMYRYLNSPNADNEYKKLQAEIAKVQSGDDAEETDVYMQPETPIMDNSYWGWW